MKIAELATLLQPSHTSFEGTLTLTHPQVTWTLSFVQGQLLYAADTAQGVRRWARSLKQHFPTCNWQTDVAQLPHHQEWQLQLLDQGITRQRLSLIRAKLVIRHIIHECLFELSQYETLDINWQPAPRFISQASRKLSLSHWESTMLFKQVGHLQQQWYRAGLPPLSLTLSPQLKSTVKAQALPNFPFEHQHLRGESTLWELANDLDRPLVGVMAILQPLWEQGFLDFVPVADLTLPKAQVPAIASTAPETALKFRRERLSKPVSYSQQTQSISPSPAPPERPISDATAPLIACIDDSPVLAHSIKKILAPAGYRTLTIQEPMRGFSQLIEHKPDLILLDLMLPNADGYSVCKFLRDTPVFVDTPIIILTGKSKPIDRARARLIGATEFLVKPPNPEQLLTMIQTHLPDRSTDSEPLKSAASGV